MIIPFKNNDVFKVSKKLNITIKNDIVIVDNFYKNYDMIHDILINMSVPNWTIAMADDKNFKDYYDCRAKMQSVYNYPSNDNPKNVILKIACDAFNLGDENDYSYSIEDYEFNYFKHINLPKNNNMQMKPHRDSQIGAVVYLDKISSGGTALYPNLDSTEAFKDENLMQDIGKIEKTIIQSKPNRLVLFSAERYHGGYIEDHSKYLNDWRINQAFFIDKKDL